MFRKTYKTWIPVFASGNPSNTLDPFVPEVWAQESLIVLNRNTVALQLVHTDFSPEIAQYGDTVNTRQPGTFTARRKGDADNVTMQAASATNVPVVLNQHLHTSFIIKDGEESKGFKNLRQEYLVPALESIAQTIDQTILMQQYQFIGNSYGLLGTTPTRASVIGVREKLTTQLVPMSGRNLLITPNTEGALLNIQDFINAEKVGDDGTALREGSLGRKFGLNTYMSQNTPSIAAGNSTTAGAINAGNLVVGSTSLTVDGFTGALTAGSWCTIGSDMTPQKITATDEGSGSDTIGITISPGLLTATVNDAVVTVYDPGAINDADNYALNAYGDMTVDGFTVAPKRGQLCTVGAASTTPKYGLIDTPTTTSIRLDRPNADALALNDAVVGIGPAGEYNFAFHRNAIAVVSRPLATPADGTGALSYVASHDGLSIRSTITYDGQRQGHLVTVDLLMGVKVLNTSLGCLFYA